MSVTLLKKPVGEILKTAKVDVHGSEIEPGQASIGVNRKVASVDARRQVRTLDLCPAILVLGQTLISWLNVCSPSPKLFL